MKCYYCENEATTKDYRTWNGQTGKELVCDHCFGLSNDGLLNMRHKVDKALKEVLAVDKDTAEGFLEKGWGEMWDIIGLEMTEHEEWIYSEFESQCGHELHPDTIDKWRDKMVAKIDKLIKKSI